MERHLWVAAADPCGLPMDCKYVATKDKDILEVYKLVAEEIDLSRGPDLEQVEMPKFTYLGKVLVK
jgi:hypothetical protein